MLTNLIKFIIFVFTKLIALSILIVSLPIFGLLITISSILVIFMFFVFICVAVVLRDPGPSSIINNTNDIRYWFYEKILNYLEFMKNTLYFSIGKTSK